MIGQVSDRSPWTLCDQFNLYSLSAMDRRDNLRNTEASSTDEIRLRLAGGQSRPGIGLRILSFTGLSSVPNLAKTLAPPT